ncbi:MAG: (2Fe-2S) ferredoxin domain-containing protein [Thainema sp.]
MAAAEPFSQRETDRDRSSTCNSNSNPNCDRNKQLVIVCQNTACRKAGSANVLKAFETAIADADVDVELEGRRCLGQCGSGPMVLVLPDQIWYERVQVAEVPAIVQRHLRDGQPIQAMLYRRFHQK